MLKEAALFYLADEAVAVGKVDRKSTRLNSSHVRSSYAVFCLKKKNRPPAGGNEARGIEGEPLADRRRTPEQRRSRPFRHSSEPSPAPSRPPCRRRAAATGVGR